MANVVTSAPLIRSRHRVLVSDRQACARCGAALLAGACAHGGSSIADISVAEVSAAARGLLAAG